METFVEFEADIHRIAHRDFVSQFSSQPPILLTSHGASPADFGHADAGGGSIVPSVRHAITSATLCRKPLDPPPL